MLPFHSGSRITQANDNEYHYECFRCEKCSQPINGTYTITPDGSRFKVSFLFKQKFFLKNIILVWKLSSKNLLIINETMC
jgi:hypothetical protein